MSRAESIEFQLEFIIMNLFQTAHFNLFQKNPILKTYTESKVSHKPWRSSAMRSSLQMFLCMCSKPFVSHGWSAILKNHPFDLLHFDLFKVHFIQIQNLWSNREQNIYSTFICRPEIYIVVYTRFYFLSAICFLKYWIFLISIKSKTPIQWSLFNYSW